MFHYDSRDTTMIMTVINHVFEDKRLTAVLVMLWLLIVLITFWSLGVMQTQFVSFGPSPQTFFMGICLHTWPRWCMVAVFTFISTAVNDFVGDALVPFITNAIQDHKTIFLPYSKFTCWAITQALSVYGCTMSIFSIYLLLSQLDFMLIRLAADSIVNLYTTYRFMKDKRVNAEKYYRSQRPFHNTDEHGAAHDTDQPGDATDPPSSHTKRRMDTLRPLNRRSASLFKLKRSGGGKGGTNQPRARAAAGSLRSQNMPTQQDLLPYTNTPDDSEQLLPPTFTLCAPSVDDINRQRIQRMRETGLDMFAPTAAVLLAPDKDSEQEEDTCIYTAQAAAEPATLEDTAAAATKDPK